MNNPISAAVSQPAALPAGNVRTVDRQAATDSIVDRLTAMYARRQRAKGRAATWHGFSMAHFLVLVQLAEGEELPMTALAHSLDVSLPSMTGIADRMAAHGLLERVRDQDDRRIVRCRLTSTGWERLAEMESMQRDKIARVLDHLDDGQLRRLDTSLTDLMAAFADAEACGDLDGADAQPRVHTTSAQPMETDRP